MNTRIFLNDTTNKIDALHKSREKFDKVGVSLYNAYLLNQIAENVSLATWMAWLRQVENAMQKDNQK
jgi:hypothetical protein